VIDFVFNFDGSPLKAGHPRNLRRPPLPSTRQPTLQAPLLTAASLQLVVFLWPSLTRLSLQWELALILLAKLA
jgi:hypothetical protein